MPVPSSAGAKERNVHILRGRDAAIVLGVLTVAYVLTCIGGGAGSLAIHAVFWGTVGLSLLATASVRAREGLGELVAFLRAIIVLPINVVLVVLQLPRLLASLPGEMRKEHHAKRLGIGVSVLDECCTRSGKPASRITPDDVQACVAGWQAAREREAAEATERDRRYWENMVVEERPDGVRVWRPRPPQGA